jgi:putative addiction module CopG family antidote
MGILLNPDLESKIAAKVRSGRYRSADEVVAEGLALLEARDVGAQLPETADAATISERIVQLGAGVPEEEWSRVPTDLARNLDHYLYGSTRNSE